MRLKWPAWRALAASEKSAILAEAAAWLETVPQTAVFSMLGHKGDLMFIHYRPDFAALNQAELALAKLRLSDYLEPTSSYLSMVELGLYESTTKIYKELTEKGLLQHTPEWNAALEETLDRQRKAMAVRLFPEFPPTKYVCFYPMDRRRGEAKNWYQVPFAERAHMMHDHGMIGRRYAGEVKQIISGSIGFDDWEWGVDLYADDPLVFKKLIYEMRFDPVSAMYALFGTFYVGLRVQTGELAGLLA
jgi:chlorite dismutase